MPGTWTIFRSLLTVITHRCGLVRPLVGCAVQSLGGFQAWDGMQPHPVLDARHLPQKFSLTLYRLFLEKLQREKLQSSHIALWEHSSH